MNNKLLTLAASIKLLGKWHTFRYIEIELSPAKSLMPRGLAICFPLLFSPCSGRFLPKGRPSHFAHNHDNMPYACGKLPLFIGRRTHAHRRMVKQWCSDHRPTSTTLGTDYPRSI